VGAVVVAVRHLSGLLLLVMAWWAAFLCAFLLQSAIVAQELASCQEASCPEDAQDSSLLQLPRRSSISQAMRGDDVGMSVGAGPIELAAKKVEDVACPPVPDSVAFTRLGSFAPPTCETIKGSVRYAESFNSLNGLFYMLPKRGMLQLLNRPVVSKWNEDATSGEECEKDRTAVERGFRPYAGMYMYEGKKWMGAVGQEITNCTPGGTPTDKAVPADVVSANLLHVPEGESRVCSPQLNQWFTVWIQLNTEDWIVGKDLGADGRNGPAQATMWWDMSSTYGTRYSEVWAIRQHIGGKVRINKVAKKPERGQWLGVDTLRKVFAKEHNFVAKTLRNNYPELVGMKSGGSSQSCTGACDEKVFGIARLIVSATVARIHTLDWTSLLLNTVTGRASQSVLWFGIKKTLEDFAKQMPGLDVGQILAQLASGLDPADPSYNNTMFGIVGGSQQQDYDFAWTEEFSLVYRMHTLLPDSMNISGNSYGLSELVTSGSTHGSKDIAKGLSATPTCALALQNYPTALKKLITAVDETGEAFDLGAWDIKASRARGAGSFNDFRRALHLDAAKSFEDLVTGGEEATDRDKRIITALEKTYNCVEDVDALVGLLAEPRLANSVLGISSYLVFALQTQTRIESDPFYTKFFDEAHYTSWGLKWVQQRTLTGMLKDHMGIDSPDVSDGEAAFKL